MGIFISNTDYHSNKTSTIVMIMTSTSDAVDSDGSEPAVKQRSMRVERWIRDVVYANRALPANLATSHCTDHRYVELQLHVTPPSFGRSPLFTDHMYVPLDVILSFIYKYIWPLPVLGDPLNCAMSQCTDHRHVYYNYTLPRPTLGDPSYETSVARGNKWIFLRPCTDHRYMCQCTFPPPVLREHL